MLWEYCVDIENSDQHSILVKTNRNFKAEFYPTRRDSKFHQFYQRYSNLDSLSWSVSSLKKGRTHSSLDPNLQHTSKICPSVINLNPGQTSFHRFRSRFPPIPLRSFEFGIPSLPSINVPSSYRFFNRAAYCRRCIPSDRGIVRVSRERSRLIRHRKTRSFPIFGFYFVPQPAGDGRNPLNSSILSR